MTKALLTVPEMQATLGGISKPTLYKLIRDGALPVVRVGRRVFGTPDGITTCVAKLPREYRQP